MASEVRSELYVITVAKRLVEYISTINEKCPKKFRYSIINKLDNLCMEIIESLYYANMYRLGDEKRRERQNEVKVILSLIDFNFLFGVKRECYTSHQYEVMSKQLNECSSYLEKWIMSDSNRIKHNG